MIKTRVLTDAEPLDNLLMGAMKLYKAVATTMGPRGNNVIFRKHGGKTGVTHDGVTVAKAVKLDDPAMDVGADLLREAAMKLDAVTGDGTTTVTVLAYQILLLAAAMIKQGASPMKLRVYLDSAVDELADLLKQDATKVTKVQQLIDVATVAAGNAKIGKEVGEAIFEAGKDTPIMLGFSQSGETTTEVINGFKVGNGPASAYLLEGSGFRLEIDFPKIIVCDADLRTKEDILPILQAISPLPPEERKFLIVANDVTGDALSLLVINKLKGFANLSVVKTPDRIQVKSAFLQDLAISCGAKVMSRNTGHTMATPALEDFGYAEKVIVELDDTIIVNGRVDQKEWDKHVAGLKKATQPEIKKFAKERLLTLEQKVVQILVGGQSETDAEERHYRYEDAVGASRAALRKGIVPGGGTALYALSESTDNPILGVALKMPLEIIYENAGVIKPEDTIEWGHGIDVLNPEKGVIDLMEAGIVDPVQSEIEALRTAVSIAGLLMTSGAMIVDEEVKDEKAPELPRFN